MTHSVRILRYPGLTLPGAVQRQRSWSEAREILNWLEQNVPRESYHLFSLGGGVCPHTFENIPGTVEFLDEKYYTLYVLRWT